MVVVFPQIKYTRSTPGGVVPTKEIDTQSKLVIMEAERMGIEWESVPDTSLIKLTYGTHVEFLRDGSPAGNTATAARICMKKDWTRAVLTGAGLPMAKGFIVFKSDSEELKKQVFESLNKPLVVKPANGALGNGVKLNISDYTEFLQHVDYIFEKIEFDGPFGLGGALVEETVLGKEYRIIATDEKVLAVMYREPASVIGDGEHTIGQLIDIKNKLEVRNISPDLYPHISLDEDMKDVLNKQSLTAESIPEMDTKVRLRNVSNIMAGGDAYDLTDEIHPSVAQIAVSAVKALSGMRMVGIDFMTTDIKADQATQQCAIIEVNSTPGYAMHDYPMYGKKRDVALTVLKMMFPEVTDN